MKKKMMMMVTTTTTMTTTCIKPTTTIIITTKQRTTNKGTVVFARTEKKALEVGVVDQSETSQRVPQRFPSIDVMAETEKEASSSPTSSAEAMVEKAATKTLLPPFSAPSVALTTKLEVMVVLKCVRSLSDV